MSRQEEIREGVREIIINGMINDQRTLYITDDVLAYIVSKGGVLTVERELPDSFVLRVESKIGFNGYYAKEDRWLDARWVKALKEQAGYAEVEPLR